MEKSKIEKWKAVAEKSRPVTPAPDEYIYDDDSVLEDLTKPDKSSQPVSKGDTDVSDSRRLPVMPVSLKMHDIALPVLIRTLARAANLDIVINESVKGQANMVITKVPWDQIFMSILDTFGLTYEWSGDILRIVTVEDLLKRQKMMEAKQKYEKAKKSHDLDMMRFSHEQEKLKPLVTKIVKVQYADLESMQKNLEQYLLSQQKKETAHGNGDKGLMEKAVNTKNSQDSGVRGSIMIDKFSNSLILHATRADIKKMMPVIRQLEQPIHQVLIEAHIVEAESNTGKQLGVQWGGLGTSWGSSAENTSIGGNMTEVGTPFPERRNDDGNLIENLPYMPADGNIVNLPIAAAEGMTLGVMVQRAGEFVLYTQLLALEEEGKLNILSKPSITTLNHRKATIKSGREVPFQTVEDDEVSIEWKEAVIKLEVIPHIVNNNIIMLEIVTHKDELDFTNPVNGNPTIITKNAKTTVTLFNGQTTVIGGLSKEKSTDGEKGVPALKDIPGLNWLFKSIDNEKKMEELLIFITPHILQKKIFSAAKKHP
ncbi:MAG: type IV pilus secretin PilQ [Thermodesulfobacteriota bacterium]|nr:type IV pilus secretin PilQ [Thermodesulfobacteriota bacterium]